MKLLIKFLIFLHIFSIFTYVLVVVKISSSIVQFEMIEIRRGISTAKKEQPVVKATNVSKILIVAYVRSGSTFTGDLIQQTPSSFLTFEPVAATTDGVMRINESSFNEAFDIINDLFECNSRIFESFHHKFKKYTRFKMANFFRDSCKSDPTNCATPESVKFYCESSHVRISKVVRLPMKAVYKFMVEHPEIRKRWKVLHLRRDPRGMFNSRSNRYWCDSSTCLNVDGMCDEIREDLYYTNKMRNNLNISIVSINYEKLLSDPMKESINLYQQLGINHTDDVKSFIESHTHSIDPLLRKHPYSTVRNSKDTVIAWRTKLKPSIITLIENECSDVIKKLGYELIYR